MKALKQLCMIVLLLTLGNATASPAQAIEETGHEDAAKMYLIRHVVQIDMKSGEVTKDGQSLGRERVPIRNGRSFIPVRLLQQLGIGSVVWDAKEKDVIVTALPELQAPIQTVVFRVGEAKLYGEDRLPYQDLPMSAPFLEKGRVYVPLQHFPVLGVAVEMKKPYITLQWTEKKFEVYRPILVTDQGEVRFTVLYESGIYDPTAFTSTGVGGWSGSSETRKLIGRDIPMDGRSFHRMQFTLPLHPGVNPILLNGVSHGGIVLEAHWQPDRAEDVPLDVNAYEPVQFTKPQYGYVVVTEGAEVVIKGTVTIDDPHMDEVTVQISQYDPKTISYVQVGEDAVIPIENLQFSGTITAPDAGTYIVRVNSPRYIAAPWGAASQVWATFVMEVLPAQ